MTTVVHESPPLQETDDDEVLILDVPNVIIAHVCFDEFTPDWFASGFVAHLGWPLRWRANRPGPQHEWNIQIGFPEPTSAEEIVLSEALQSTFSAVIDEVQTLLKGLDNENINPSSPVQVHDGDHNE